MGIDQFPSPFKVKPLIKKQKSETPAQSEIHTPSKSKVIENSRTITSIEHDNRQEDVLSWIDDLDSRIKRTLSRQYIESIELKNQTNMEDMREKYRQVPFDDSFRKLSSILKKGNEVDSDQEASYEVAEGKLPTDNEDDEMDFSEDVETNETPELESEGQSDDDIIEIISSEREEAFDSGNISNNYEENEQDEEVTPGLNINALRTQGVTYHIKNGRPRLSDNYMNINDSEQNEKSEYSSEYSNGNDDGIDIDETNGDEDEDEDEHENGNEVEYEGEYEEEHEERRNQDDSDDEIIILDSDEENNNTQINKEKNFDSGSNPASFSFYEDSENGIQDNLSNGVDHDDNEDEDEDEDENEHQEYVYPNNNLENNSSISSVYSNQVELLNENKVIDEKDNLMSLAEAVLKESNDMSDENSFMTARGSDSLYQDDKSGIAQYSTNINSGYTADYDSTDVNYQAANLSGIEEENKEVTDPVAHTHEPFLKEDSVSSDSIQLVDDFENISEGSLADEEQDYEDSSNNDRGFTLNKHKIYEHSGAYEIKEEESNEDNYSIEVEHINEVPIFKTVAEEDPETVLFKLKEAEQKFHIRLNSIKCLEDELILKNGHLPESYIPNQFVEEDQNDISSNKTYGKEVVADFGSIPKPIPKPLLQDLSILDETTILETMNDGDNKEGSISSPVLKQLDDGKTVIDETSIMDDNDNDSQKGFKPEYVSGPILGQIGLDQSDNTPVNDIEESKHEVFQGPNLNPIYYDTPEVKDSTYNVSHDVRQHDTDGDEIDHIRGPLLDQIDDNKSQTNDIIMSRMDEEKECIDVPALEEHDSDQSRIYNTTMNEMEVDMNENISNDVLEHTESSQSNSNDKILEQAEQDEKYINVLSLEQVEADQSRIDDTTMNDSVEENQESISTPALEQIEIDQSRIDDTTMNESVEENQESIPTPALEQIESDQSRIDDTTMNETVEENQESIPIPALEQVEADQSRIDDTTMNETLEENQESISTPALEQIEVDKSTINDTTVNETVEENQESIPIPALEQVEADQSRIDDTTMNETLEENQESISTPALEKIEVDKSTINDTTVNETVEENQESISTPALEQIEVDQSRIDDTTMNDSVEENQESISTPALEKIEVDKSTINDTTVNETVEENQESIPIPALEQVEADQSRIDDTTMNETLEENQESISTPALEQIEVDKSTINDTTVNETVEENQESIPIPALEQVEADQSRIDDTTMNETLEENQESISTPALEKIEVDKSTINDTTVNETVEENQESIPTPALEQIEADQSTINDTTVNETVEENQESISTPALEQIEVDQSRIDDTTMNDSVEENQESIPTPALEQIESDQSRIDDITMNETVEENQESIPIPALEQVEADQSRIDDTTMNETLEENDRINVPKLKQIGVEQSGVADTTIIEMNIEQDDNVPNDLLSPDMEQVESHESIIDTPDEMADDNQGLLNSPKSEVIEQSNFGLATDEIQEMKDKLLPEVTESLREKSISEMLYPSITQELDDIHNGHDESKIDIETTIADNEVVNKDIDAKYESYTEKEKNALDQIPINIDKNDIDLNKDVEFDTSDEYENKRSLSSEQIVEEPQEADENIIFEYEQTTYVNVMGDGILHPSYIMEPIEEQQETQLPDYIEQLEIITGTSAIDDMEVLEPSAIIEPSDTETDRAELINSAFEQQFEIIEPTGVLEPPSRSQTPKLSGTHRESINAEEIFEKGSSKGSRKRNRESESFVRSKLRKLIYKPFQWLSKNRKSSPISPTHIEAPKLRPLDDNTANSSSNKNARKPIQKDADIKPDDSVDKNKKKYYELMRHLKRSVDLKSSEVEKNNLNNLVDYEKEEDNSDDHMIDDEDKSDYSAVNENEPSINAPTNVKEKTFEDENLEQSINESHAKNSSFATNSDYNPPFTELEINDSAKNSKSTKQRSTSAKSKRPRKVLGLDMSEAHIEPVRSLRSGHKYGPEENDHQTSDLLASPNKTLRSNKELPKLRINKRRHLSNTKALDNSSPIEIDSKQSSPSSRKSSGSKWVESSLDHPALRTRSKSPLKRSIYQISSDLEEDSNLPRRSSRLRHPNEKLNDDAALENENTEAEEEVKRGRPTKRH